MVEEGGPLARRSGERLVVHGFEPLPALDAHD
jgi:hypothetical protein